MLDSIRTANGGHVFCQIKMSSRILIEFHQRNIHAKIKLNPLNHFGEEEFLKFHYIYNSYSVNKHRPRWPCFLLIKMSSRDLKKTLPKEHSDQITMKSSEWFWRRRFFKFFLLVAMATRVLQGINFF